MRRSLFLAFLILTAGFVEPAAAQYARGHVRAGAVLPLDEILGIIRHSRAGSFYDADGPFSGPDGRPHYRIKWMTPSGRVIWLDTDARTGRVLGVEGAETRRPSWEQGGPYGGDRDDRRYQPRYQERREPPPRNEGPGLFGGGGILGGILGGGRDGDGDWDRGGGGGRRYDRGRGDRNGPRDN